VRGCRPSVVSNVTGDPAAIAIVRIRASKAAKCEKIFQEKISGARAMTKAPSVMAPRHARRSRASLSHDRNASPRVAQKAARETFFPSGRKSFCWPLEETSPRSCAASYSSARRRLAGLKAMRVLKVRPVASVHARTLGAVPWAYQSRCGSSLSRCLPSATTWNAA
jgi:hypothetical protein